jgi:hypothetical protein
MINSFFGGKKEHPKKKKKTVEETMTAGPSPSVSPEERRPETTATVSPVASP